MKKITAFILVLSLTLQMFCISASAEPVPSIAGHKGLIIEKEDIPDATNKKFKLNIYAYGEDFNMTSLNFTYKEKVSLIYPSTYKPLANSASIAEAVKFAEKEIMINVAGEEKLVSVPINGSTVPYTGWAQSPMSWTANDKKIKIDTSIGTNNTNFAAMGFDPVNQKISLSDDEKYLLYSIYFTANGDVTTGGIYSSDFTLEGIAGTNTSGSLLGYEFGTTDIFLDAYYENFPIEGQAMISGTPTVGETLSATVSGLTSTIPAIYSYQWLADGSEISNETKTSLFLNADLAGKNIKVKISAEGYVGDLLSFESADVEPLTPSLVSKTDTKVILNIQPNCQYGLTSGGAWQGTSEFTDLMQGTSYSFYVKAGDSVCALPLEVITMRSKPSNLIASKATSKTNLDGSIAGLESAKKYEYKATDAADYIPVADGATTISGLGVNTYLVRLSADGAIEPSCEAEIAVTQDDIKGEAIIGGICFVGNDLTANVLDGTVGATYSYLWKADGDIIAGATMNTLALVPELAGKKISVLVSGAGDYSGNLAESSKTIAIAPKKPEMLSKTDTAVTLKEQIHCLFTYDDGATWQNHLFTGLNQNSIYRFRVKAGESSNPEVLEIMTLRAKPTNLLAKAATSAVELDGEITGLDNTLKYEYKTTGAGEYIAVADGATTISGLKAGNYAVRLATAGSIEPSMYAEVIVKGNRLAGVANITGIPSVGETLTASITGGDGNETCTYIWKSSGVAIENATNKTLVLPDTTAGKKISVSIIGIESYDGTLESQETTMVVPQKPTVLSRTDTKIILSTQPNCQYKRDSLEWTDSPIFDNLTEGAIYNFSAKAGESDSSDFVPVRTLRSKPTNLVASMASNTSSLDGKITGLDDTKKYEYKIKTASGDYTTVTPGATTISGLGANTYYVRFVSEAGVETNSEPSLDAEVVVGAPSNGGGGSNKKPVVVPPVVVPPVVVPPVVVPPVEAPVLKDIQKHWANIDINYMVSKGMVKGVDEKSFEPDSKITRAQFITILFRFTKDDVNKYTGTDFLDVKTEDWFAPYVAWASKSGVTSGLLQDKFAPDDYITREQMAVMIDRFANVSNFKLEKKVEVKEFVDSNNASDYATSAILKVQQAGIINGTPQNTFEPNSNATRAESITMLSRLLRDMLGE